MKRHAALALLLLLGACKRDSVAASTTSTQAASAQEENCPGGGGEHAAAAKDHCEGGATAPAAPRELGSQQHFGRELSDAVGVTDLNSLLSAPETYAGKLVKTEGQISAVCQARGCWMELRSEGNTPLRVPMAGHSFLVPRDSAGKRAVVEGKISLRPLTDSMREHLRREGASVAATSMAVSLEAEAVAIN